MQSEPITYQGVPLDPPQRLDEENGPRYYVLNHEALAWSERTGRPLWEWLWRSRDGVDG